MKVIFILNIIVTYDDWRDGVLSALCYSYLIRCRIYMRNCQNCQIDYLQSWVIDCSFATEIILYKRIPCMKSKTTSYTNLAWNVKSNWVNSLERKYTVWILITHLHSVFGSVLQLRMLGSRTLCLSYYKTMTYDDVFFGKWISGLRKKLLPPSS